MSYTTTSFSFSKLDQDVVLDGFPWEEIYLSCIYPSVKGYISCEVVKDLSGWLQSFTNCTNIISCEPFLPPAVEAKVVIGNFGPIVRS